MDDLERVTYIAVRGEVINIERKSTTTSVIVQEGSSNVPYPLDSELIEFGTAIGRGLDIFRNNSDLNFDPTSKKTMAI